VTNATAQVLVVDDDERHAASVRELLWAHGYRADFEIGGEAGLDRLAGERIDVLILDLDLPDIAGADVLRLLKANNAAVKTIVVSGESRCDDIGPLLRLGICDYLAKPYEPEQLVKSVSNALARSAEERERRAQWQQREAFIQALPDLVYLLDGQGRFAFISDRVSDVFGFDRNSLVGKPWTELLGEDLAEPLKHRFDERRCGARATRWLDFEWCDPRGVQHVIELSATGMYGSEQPQQQEFCGTAGSLRDVTAIRHELGSLAASEQRYRSLFSAAPIAMFVSRLDDGRMIESNAAFDTLITRSSTDSDMIVFGDASARDAFIDGLATDACDSAILLEQSDPADGRFLELRGRRFTVESVDYLQVTVADVTANERHRRSHAERIAERHRSEMRAAVQRMAGSVAHDFNDLLARVIGYGEGIRDALSGIEYQRSSRLLEELFATTRRARDLISQLLMAVAPQPPPTTARKSRALIVLVDSEQSIGELLVDVLEWAGFQAVAFTDRDMAWQHIAANTGDIALVLLDEPDIGDDAARLASQLHTLPDAPPVVTMRSCSPVPHGVGTAAAVLTKPFSMEVLLEAVRTHAREQRGAAAATI
jgi:PAS domain S-box-containing protein